jgi:hypothetical protein
VTEALKTWLASTTRKSSARHTPDFSHTVTQQPGMHMLTHSVACERVRPLRWQLATLES